ncbi:hypothetical protein AU467_02680 [Mesorhizobium loti]|uniref:Bacterial bifunctional deaminase-reductase C-terminal domain-containing protein n=1 Tax=Rhizobium loti TaxID=381 RepID=A0A117N426_RHILI|nr:hypothetical protein AU467_02680 [Mesorhizobium loti]
MATSVNGFTARENGAEDFLTSPLWQMFLELVRAADVIIWGRRTHELFVESVLREVPAVRGIVLTSHDKLEIPTGWFQAPSPVAIHELLKSNGFNNALLTGGSTANESFARANLIDRVVLALEPVIIGSGIPLVGRNSPDLRLELIDVDLTRKPKVKLTYQVHKGTN